MVAGGESSSFNENIEQKSTSDKGGSSSELNFTDIMRDNKSDSLKSDSKNDSSSTLGSLEIEDSSKAENTLESDKIDQSDKVSDAPNKIELPSLKDIGENLDSGIKSLKEQGVDLTDLNAWAGFHGAQLDKALGVGSTNMSAGEIARAAQAMAEGAGAALTSGMGSKIFEKLVNGGAAAVGAAVGSAQDKK